MVFTVFEWKRVNSYAKFHEKNDAIMFLLI